MDDNNSDYSDKLIRINALHDTVRNIFGKNISDNHFQALSYTIEKYNIPEKYFHDLLIGLEMDKQIVSFSSFNELRKYCYHVASVVGLMLTHVFGVKDSLAFEYAESLGIAMQLTNILRDIKEDAMASRIYIPKDELKAFNYTEEDIRNSIINDNFKLLMKFEINRAYEYYEHGLRGLPYLSNDGSRTTAVIMYKTYSGILSRIIKSDYDVYSKRHYVSLSKKMALTLGYLINWKEKNKYSLLPNIEEAFRKA